MFTELQNVRQIKGEHKRRWFTDEDFELIVWLGDHDRIIGFQLCYALDRQPKALTWIEKKGFLHTGIDEGERPWRSKATPVLIPDGVFDRNAIEKRFIASSQSLPGDISNFVKSKIDEYKTERK